jgi:hypothetical protein
MSDEPQVQPTEDVLVKNRDAALQNGALRPDRGQGRNRLTWRGTTDDGTLTYSLTRGLDGLHIDRLRIRTDGRRNAQSLLFVDAASFGAWCDSDDMRYLYVHLCIAVRTKGLELFDQHPFGADVQRTLRFG